MSATRSLPVHVKPSGISAPSANAGLVSASFGAFFAATAGSAAATESADDAIARSAIACARRCRLTNVRSMLSNSGPALRVLVTRTLLEAARQHAAPVGRGLAGHAVGVRSMIWRSS